MAKKKKSRLYLIAGSAVLVVLLMLYAFWPSATMVDMGSVSRGAMRVTIDEEGRTRVQDSYLVSMPVAGRLQRVQVEVGDSVAAGSVVAVLLPVPLDARARAQARADVAGAQAALHAAQENAAIALAERALADSNLSREEQLWALDSTSRQALETARRDARSAAANADVNAANIVQRQSELDRAQAQLAEGQAGIAIRAPVSGRVLAIEQQSEATLAAGNPIMEIGRVESDLEVLVELLSSDAVKVEPGDSVSIEQWGGEAPLAGVIERIEPQGFTKVSALGVEEQRVNTIVRLIDGQAGQAALGSGFRVEARIVIWQEENALLVPSSALFRDQQDWAVFVVEGGTARLRNVTIGRNNGTQAQVVEGLAEGETVILYPASDIVDGADVQQREVG